MAVLEIEEATNLAHKMVVYIESEQRDLLRLMKINLMLYGKVFTMFVH